ncbi:MAG: hypothetical protein ABR955_01790 [Verrucomicrobiota bacterium]|jgi:uncharacterized membrane protein
MKTKSKKIIGWLLILFGILVVVFSNKIVFPGLERLIGIETIVGKENVSYNPDGSYYYTNPGAMLRWIASVAAIGILIFFTGVWLLIRSKKNRKG